MNLRESKRKSRLRSGSTQFEASERMRDNPSCGRAHCLLSIDEKNRQMIQEHFEDVSKWIDTIVEKLAAGCKFDGIDSTFKRS